MSKLEEASIKNQSRIDLNLGKHFGIDFPSMFLDFGSQDGAKLGGEIDKKSIQKGMPKK